MNAEGQVADLGQATCGSTSDLSRIQGDPLEVVRQCRGGLVVNKGSLLESTLLAMT